MPLGTRRVVSVVAVILGIAFSSHLAGAQDAATGGFIESAASSSIRPRLSPAEIQAFVPSRGVFQFPAPYLTQGIRVTNASDCGGADCVTPVGYSYWNNINNHAGSDTMLIFVGLERRRGGGGPALFSYNKRTGETRNLGPLFSPDSAFSWSTGEGWYFSRTRPHALYVNQGPRLYRYDVMSRQFETVFDASPQFGADRYLWQIHSSNDDRVHSATLRHSGTYEMLGCVAYREDTRQATFVPKRGDFDECQVDKSGRWLVIKENVDGLSGEDNRIVDLQTGAERVLLDQNGAAGHSDIGYGYMVAEDNWYSRPGAVRVWRFDFDLGTGNPQQGRLVYALQSWSSGIGHVAHGNARSDLDVERQTACSSNATRLELPRVNEIVCYPLDGSLSALVVAPNLTDLNAPGGGSDDYSKLPKGNLDVTGEYFIWTANAGTHRADIFIVRIPQAALGGTPAPVPAPSPSPAPPPGPAPGPSASIAEPVRWTNLVNVTASGNSLQKTSGCQGCPDAGAMSEQQIGSGNGFVEFRASEAETLRAIGLTATGGIDPAGFSFALRLQGGVAEVRESGAYRSDVRFAPGDALRIAVEQGRVTYSKNGAVFYTSGTPAVAGLRIAACLWDLNATLTNVLIMSGASSPTLVPTSPAGGDGGTGQSQPALPKPSSIRRRGW